MSEFEKAGADSHEESAPEPTPGLPPSRRLEVITGVVAAILSAAMIALSRAVVVIRETGGVDPRWWPTVRGIRSEERRGGSEGRSGEAAEHERETAEWRER